MNEEIKTDNAPAARGLLSQAVMSGNLVFTAGQIHLTTDGKLVGETMTEKTRQVMNNISAILEAAGTSLSNVVKATVYVTDMEGYGEFNEAYKTYFTEPFPAREVVCVKELPLGASLEISVVASR